MNERFSMSSIRVRRRAVKPGQIERTQKKNENENDNNMVEAGGDAVRDGGFCRRRPRRKRRDGADAERRRHAHWRVRGLRNHHCRRRDRHVQQRDRHARERQRRRRTDTWRRDDHPRRRLGELGRAYADVGIRRRRHIVCRRPYAYDRWNRIARCSGRQWRCRHRRKREHGVEMRQYRHRGRHDCRHRRRRRFSHRRRSL